MALPSPEEIKSDLYDHYIDVDGLVTVDKDPTPQSTGNGAMHLGLAHTMIQALKASTYTDKMAFHDAVKKLEVSPGVYNRNPGRSDQNGHDDITGIVAGSVSYNLEFHKDVAEHLLTHIGIFNNDGKLELRDFLARQIFHAVYWLLMGYSYKALFARPILLPILLLKVLLPSSSYTIQHNYMMLETLAIKFTWLKWIRNLRVGNMGLADECARYYKSEEHPMAQLARHIENSKV